MVRNIESAVGELLTKQKKTISIAESCTGGRVTDLITNIAGSSTYFLGGVIVYTNQAKMDILKISEQIIQEESAVSRGCAVNMANNVKTLLRTDIGIGITGIAGPAGGSSGKPVGSVYVAITDGTKIACKLFKFEGNRLDIKQKAAQNTLKMVKEFIAE